MFGQKGVPATWGGVEQHVHHLSKQLSSAGNAVIVYSRRHYVSPKKAEQFQKEHPLVRIVFTPTLRTKHFDTIISTLFAVTHALLFVRPDVYHFHSVGPSLLSFLPRVFAPNARVIATFHSPDRLHGKWGSFARLMLTLGERAALSFPHQTIVVSRELQDYAQEAYGKHAWYIPNGVEVQDGEDVGSELLAGLGLSPQDYAIVVNRLVPHKGVHFAIEAWMRLETDKKLAIVGDAAIGTEEYVSQLKDLAANDPRIIFTGFQTGRALKQIYANAYASIHPSDSEGLSIALLEAASFGKGIIASNIPANVEVVQHGGFFFDKGDVDGLTEQCAFILKNPHVLKVAGRSIKEHVKQQYNWDDIAKNTTRLYNHGGINEQSFDLYEAYDPAVQ